MSCNSFKELMKHRGHEIRVVSYGSPAENVSVECETCGEVLLDFDSDFERIVILKVKNKKG